MTTLLFVFSIAFGIFDYSTVPVTASFVASHLGLRIMGLAMGALAMGHALGAATGAFLGGYVFDLFAQYQQLWVLSFSLAIVSAALVLTIKNDQVGDLVAGDSVFEAARP